MRKAEHGCNFLHLIERCMVMLLAILIAESSAGTGYHSARFLQKHTMDYFADEGLSFY